MADHHRSPALTAAHAHYACALQACHRLVDGVATHCQALGEVNLAWETISWLKQPSVDRINKHGHDLIDGLANHERLEHIGGYTAMVAVCD